MKVVVEIDETNDIVRGHLQAKDVDVLVFSEKKLQKGEKTVLVPFGIIETADKTLIIASDMQLEDWSDLSEAQRVRVFAYFKSIESIESKRAAEEYIIESYTE